MGILSRLFGSNPPLPDPMRDTARAILARLPGTDRIALMKLVYIAQVMHLGRTGQRLLPHWFKATAMGPYDKDVSRACAALIRQKAAGTRWTTGTTSLDDVAIGIIDEVCAAFRGAGAGSIQAAISRKGGAWDRLYEADPFSLMPISDPNRWKTRRRPSDEGPFIDLDHMRIDYSMFTQPTDKAA